MSDRIAERMQTSMSSMAFSESEKKMICVQLGIRAAQAERMGSMNKRVRTRRIVAIAVVCVMVMGAAAFAAGKISMTFGHGHSGYDYRTEDDLSKAALNNNLASLPGQFSNGYKLEGGNEEKVNGADDGGNIISTWTEVSADYIYQGKRVTVSESRTPAGFTEASGVKADDTRVIIGIDVTSRYFDYLFVPPDYEPDEEIAAREKEDSHFTISYGSDKVTNERADFVTFEKNGISYNIMSFDGVSKDDLFAIAEGLIK